MSKSDDSVADEVVGWDVNNYSSFLAKYWQKKPLLVRSAFDVSTLLRINGSDLLKLSLEEDVESRLVFRKGDKWKKEYGPFEPKRINTLKRDNWTVLVQEVDRHIPSVADIWSTHFSFIPSWRRDDVMMSYAAPGGGIGAHVDNYDVFLIQGSGRRRWSIENRFVSHEEERQREVPSADTRLLSGFVEGQGWDLGPGDMLYLPPRIPHRGVSLGEECVTVSMGFRAPSQRSLLVAFCEHVCQHYVGQDEMYSDADLAPQTSQGFIAEAARKTIATTLTDKLRSVLEDGVAFDEWLGSYLTTPLRMHLRSPGPFFLDPAYMAELRAQGSANEEEDEEEEDEDAPMPLALSQTYRVASRRLFRSADHLVAELAAGTVHLRRAEWVRSAYVGNLLFFNGKKFIAPASLSEILGPIFCGPRSVEHASLRPHLPSETEKDDCSELEAARRRDFETFLKKLVVSGYFYPVDTEIANSG